MKLKPIGFALKSLKYSRCVKNKYLIETKANNDAKKLINVTNTPTPTGLAVQFIRQNESTTKKA